MKCLIPLLAAGIMASLSIMAGIGTVHAQEKTEARFNSAVTPRRIAMGVGKSVIIDLPQDAAEIFVANRRVANAVVRSPRKLYVIGMDTGQTSVFALDQQGRQIAALEPSIGRDIGELQQILRAAMPAEAITARTVNDTIILIGAVDSIEDAQRAGDIAKGFIQQVSAAGPPGIAGGPSGASGVSADGRIVNVLTIRGRDQVMLKVTVAEVERNIAKQLGITTSSVTASWGTFTQFNPFAINGVIASVAGSSIGYPANATTTALTAHNPANTLSATLQAFERYGVSRILAEPTVSAVSGESAKLTVGGEIPVPTAPSCTGNGVCQIGTEFKDYGVSLRFTPVVLAEGRILLHLATEVTEIDTQTAQIISGTLVPGFLTRKNETTVEIPSGGSIASAGLLQTISKQAINGLPGLLDLPVLGALFRSNDYQRQETELMIVVTPYIIKPAQPNEIAKPADGFADASDPQTWLLGRVNQLYASPSNPEAIKDYKGPVGFIPD
ncbi:MAG: type II and III secretion system protein family protein [Pseudomonadota bacterium]|nr:type II and III secretion system protein family protein [Pseudomonadota bacterium]